MTAEKPLFIPLQAVYFDAFADGTKDTEFRAYGPRWNERTCLIGRQATLSRGYGKKHRLQRVVVGFERRRLADYQHLIGTSDVACIQLAPRAPEVTP